MSNTLQKMIKEYQKLQRLNPQHKLLSLVKDVKKDEFKITKEFSRKYDKEDREKGMYYDGNIFMGYYKDLKKAVTTELK